MHLGTLSVVQVQCLQMYTICSTVQCLQRSSLIGGNASCDQDRLTSLWACWLVCVLQSGVLGAGIESQTTMGCGCVDFTGRPRVAVDWVSAFAGSDTIDIEVGTSCSTRCFIFVGGATNARTGSLHSRHGKWSWCRRTTHPSYGWAVDDTDLCVD